MWKFFILCFVYFVKCDEICILKNEDNVDIVWDEFLSNSLGQFEKTIGQGETLPGIIIQLTKLQDIQDVECNYFEIKQTNDTYISIVSTDGFNNWDTTNAVDTCKFTLVFDTSMCTTPDAASFPINFEYKIIDVNINTPNFNEADFKIKAAFPIAPGVNLNDLSNLDIYTTDIDFSTKKITYSFESESEDFQLVPLPKNGNKFPVSLVSKQLLNLQKSVVLTILATDDGTNPTSLNDTTTITIEPDLENSIPPVPEITEPLYSVGDVKFEDLKAGYVLPIDDLTLKKEYENCQLSIDPADTFEATLNVKQITVKLIKDIEQDGQQFLIAKLTATITQSSKISQSTSVILINFSGNTEPTSSTTTEITTVTDGSTSSTTLTPENDDDDPDTGLMAGTIIFAITTAILLAIVGYGYFKYVHKKSVIVPTSHGFQPSDRNKENSSGLVVENEKPHVRKVSRKRSVTFTENDVASRANRENSVDLEASVQDS